MDRFSIRAAVGLTPAQMRSRSVAGPSESSQRPGPCPLGVLDRPRVPAGASAEGSGAGTSRPQRALERADPHAAAPSWTVTVTAQTPNLAASPRNRCGNRQYDILLSFLPQAFENPGLPHLALREALGLCREEMGGPVPRPL